MKDKILAGYLRLSNGNARKSGSHFGDGNSGEKIVDILMSELR